MQLRYKIKGNCILVKLQNGGFFFSLGVNNDTIFADITKSATIQDDIICPFNTVTFISAHKKQQKYDLAFHFWFSDRISLIKMSPLT